MRISRSRSDSRTRPKFTVFQITQAAVNEARGPGRGPAADVTFIDKQHFQPAHCRVASDARAVDSCPDNDYFVFGIQCRFLLFVLFRVISWIAFSA